ncbi:response regulator transcription factor [Rubritalea sp.]|uniref:response regulator transcription factor n=1 Tax=Rubritalea sp. TaxID=2109375 RepID=UPI003EF70B31
MSATILIVEDDSSIRQAVVEELRAQGWKVEQAMDGELGLELAMGKAFDCLVLDLMLPRIHGYEICKSLRREGKEVPIIMMSALGEERNVLKGFEVGTTDYLRKPFSLAELVMRIKVHLGDVGGETLAFLEYKLHLQTSALTLPSGDQVTLTKKEKGVLLCLIQKKGHVLTRQALLNEVWGNHWTLGERSVDRCIKTLRQKLSDPVELKTIRQAGYTWVQSTRA